MSDIKELTKSQNLILRISINLRISIKIPVVSQRLEWGFWFLNRLNTGEDQMVLGPLDAFYLC